MTCREKTKTMEKENNMKNLFSHHIFRKRFLSMSSLNPEHLTPWIRSTLSRPSADPVAPSGERSLCHLPAHPPLGGAARWAPRSFRGLRWVRWSYRGPLSDLFLTLSDLHFVDHQLPQIVVFRWKQGCRCVNTSVYLMDKGCCWQVERVTTKTQVVFNIVHVQWYFKYTCWVCQ